MRENSSWLCFGSDSFMGLEKCHLSMIDCCCSLNLTGSSWNYCCLGENFRKTSLTAEAPIELGAAG